MPVTINGTTGVVTPGATIGSINGILKSSSGVVSQASVGTDYSQLTLATAQTASGNAVDFTGIPSWAKRITVMFSGISTNGTSNPVIQVGTSSGVITSGYAGAGSEVGSTTAVNAYTLGFAIRSGISTNTVHGAISLFCLNVSSNIWVASGVTSQPSFPFTHQIAGTIALSNTLDRVRITTVNGTDTFDAGTINISYE